MATGYHSRIEEGPTWGPLLLLCPAVALAQAIPEVRVEAARPQAPTSLTPLERYGADFIAQTDGFTTDEVLASVTADLPGTEPVVLIDGRESQVDISTIPAELIDHIDVSTSGQMPDGRPPRAEHRNPGDALLQRILHAR